MAIGTGIEPAKLVGEGGHVGEATRSFGRRCSRWGLHNEILGKRGNLPIWQHKDEFLKAFTRHQALILVAEPGSGKSTQVPQFVLEAVTNDTQTTASESQGSKYMIGCTQPQRVAAMSASQQVAKEMDVTLGEEVGYSVRFEDCTSATTVLNYLTDGMLLREAMTDPLLERYKVIIVDEAHQRTLETDVLLALLKNLLKKRPNDLKLVVMSATNLEAEKFRGYFCGAPVVEVPQRLHPVDIVYSLQEQQRETNHLEAVIQTLSQIHSFEPPGDILVFLNEEEEEIEDVCRRIASEMANLGSQVGPVKVVPLCSTLPLAMQQDVFEPAPAPLLEGGAAGRKIVVSANIGETSLAIDGIVYVVDLGFSKQKVRPRVGTEYLVSWISKASAHQRSSCAGRTQPGKCFRLYTEKNFQNDLEPHTTPEITRSNLVSIVLTLKKLGIDDIVHFDFMDPPAQESLMSAVEVLKYLSALDDDGNMTRLGEILSEFPVDPNMAKMLVVSSGFNCSNEAVSVSAMFLVPNCFIRPQEAQIAADDARARFAHGDGDHLMLLNVYNAYRQNKEDLLWCERNFINRRVLVDAENAREHLSRIMVRSGLKLCSTDVNSPDYYINIRKAMLAGYITQVARLEHPTGHYLTVIGNQMVELHPSNCLDHAAEWVVYFDYLSTTGIKKFIRMVTDVRGRWLADVTLRYFDLTKLRNSLAKRFLERLYKQQEKGRGECRRREAKRVLEILKEQQEKELEQIKKEIRIHKMALGLMTYRY